MKKIRVAVIGGGASGMMAAITAAGEGAEVFLYEANDRVGKKILATGNGKCNFSNRDCSLENYYSKDKKTLETVLERFGAEDSIAFFERAGMLVKEKNGYLYPASEQASTVLDILRMQLLESGVQVLTHSRVKGIRRDKAGCFWVETEKSGKSFERVILACGGKAAPKTGSDGNGYRLAQSMGHTLTPIVPALVQLRCAEEYVKAVAGVRLDAKVSLSVNGRQEGSERGELQLTDYGISGIVVFQLSRIAAYGLLCKKKVSVYIDCLPDFSPKEYAILVQQRKKTGGGKTVEEFFTGMLNKKLMLLFIKLAGLKGSELFKNEDSKKIDRVFALCKSFPLTIKASNSFDNAQVCAGGIPLSEVSDSLESLLVKGLYFAGEILDVDGKCGGYNLQWAWASGHMAGKSAARTDKNR